jgi:hypothetical protein
VKPRQGVDVGGDLAAGRAAADDGDAQRHIRRVSKAALQMLAQPPQVADRLDRPDPIGRGGESVNHDFAADVDRQQIVREARAGGQTNGAPTAVQADRAITNEAPAKAFDEGLRIDTVEVALVDAPEHAGGESGVPEVARIDENELGARLQQRLPVQRDVQMGVAGADQDHFPLLWCTIDFGHLLQRLVLRAFDPRPNNAL